VTAAWAPSKIREQITFERLFLLLFLVAILARFVLLDLKLFHHDEAIHAWFSYRLLTEGIYQYDPMYHGPFLYYVTAGMFSLFGASDLVGRLLPSLFGVLLIPLVYLIHRIGYLDRRQTLVAALFIAVSPNMVYFSRFLRNDVFIAFFTLALLVALLYYLEHGKTQYALLGAAAVGLGMSSKENMPIVLAIFGSYLLYMVLSGRVQLPKSWKTDLLLSAFVVVGIMALFYSSFGAHPEVLADGWLRAIEHWTSMHGQQRLGGPWFFYLMLLVLYEIPILILAIVGAAQFLSAGSSGLPTLAQLKERLTGVRKTEAELPAPVRAFNKQDEFVRLCIVWALLSLAAYAYIGEKVPWLILHQLLPLIFIAVYKMSDRKLILSVAAAVFLIGMTWHVAFVPVDINEPIVQVQNSEDLREIMALIDASDSVAIATDVYWPLPWYYHGNASQKLTYYSRKTDEQSIYSRDFDLVIAHDTDSYESLTGYEMREYRHSYWFSTYDNQDRLLEYYFKRDGKMGSVNYDVFVKSPGMQESA